MAGEKIQKLCEYIDRNKAKLYPIFNDMLKGETDYIKNAYFKMLAVILEQGEEIGDPQRNLFERQITGVSCDYSMADYIRQALEIEIEEYVNFTDQCRTLPIRYRFLLDALLFVSIGQLCQEQTKLVASFAESLKIRKEELRYLAQAAKAILEQDAIGCMELQENRVLSVPDDVMKEYISAMFIDPVWQNDSMTILYGGNSEDNSIEELNIIEEHATPNIMLMGIYIKPEQHPLVFSQYESVTFVDCVFEGGKKPIDFLNCGKVRVKSCLFRGFKTRTITCNQIEEMIFEDSKFEDCEYQYSRESDDWRALGGIIYSSKSDTIKKSSFSQCMFKNCGGRNVKNYYSSQFISNCRSELRDCLFDNCWNYCYKINIDPDVPMRTMFPKDSTAVKCKVVNSAKIC
jgi:hypothetical protein